MKKPLIGLTMSFLEEKRQCTLYDDYVQAILLSGGIPMPIPVTENREVLQTYASLCDGFLFVGGPDIDPARYGEVRLPACGKPNVRRDENEAALFAWVKDTRKPLFGICRGIQTVNVLMGGTLVQDIPSQIGNSVVHNDEAGGARHTVSVVAGTQLAALLGRDEISVNSFHHQAVKKIAPNLLVSALSPDGVIEAVESKTGAPFVMAVQWHPERTFAEENSRKLFVNFVEKCAEFSKNSNLLG